MRIRGGVLGLVVTLVLVGRAAGQEESWAFSDWRDDPESVEAFLRTATVIDSERIPIGVSRPLRLTLEGGGVTARAIFKDIDVYEPKMDFEDGTFELNFRDSYKNEIAAYQLDRLLNLGLVPPTVERRIDGKAGAVRLWIEEAMTEAERLEKGQDAKDPATWSNEVAVVRIFFNLTSNSDYNNIRNLLVDSEGRICAVDHSRAFRTQKKLISEEMMMRFPRSLLEKMAALEQEGLTVELGEWVTKSQVKALLKRRDLIASRAAKLVEVKGEDLVLYD